MGQYKARGQHVKYCTTNKLRRCHSPLYTSLSYSVCQYARHPLRVYFRNERVWGCILPPYHQEVGAAFISSNIHEAFIEHYMPPFCTWRAWTDTWWKHSPLLIHDLDRTRQLRITERGVWLATMLRIAQEVASKRAGTDHAASQNQSANWWNWFPLRSGNHYTVLQHSYQ